MVDDEGLSSQLRGAIHSGKFQQGHQQRQILPLEPSGAQHISSGELDTVRNWFHVILDSKQGWPECWECSGRAVPDTPAASSLDLPNIASSFEAQKLFCFGLVYVATSISQTLGKRPGSVAEQDNLVWLYLPSPKSVCSYMNRQCTGSFKPSPTETTADLTPGWFQAS